MRQVLCPAPGNFQETENISMFDQQQALANFQAGDGVITDDGHCPGTDRCSRISPRPLNRQLVSAVAHATATPIQYLVVIFNENISFDHYFGTYPNALNPKFENKFMAKANTPTVNGLTDALLNAQPESEPGQWHGRHQSVPARCYAGRDCRSGS